MIYYHTGRLRTIRNHSMFHSCWGHALCLLRIENPNCIMNTERKRTRNMYNFLLLFIIFCTIHYVQRTLCNVFATCPSCTTGYSNWNNMWLPKRSSLRSVRRQTSRNIIYSISLCVFAACAASIGSLSTLCNAHGSVAVEYTWTSIELNALWNR